jgi:hypothetical protein
MMEGDLLEMIDSLNAYLQEQLIEEYAGDSI